MTGDRVFDIDGESEEVAVLGPAVGEDVADGQPVPDERDAPANAPDESRGAGAPARKPGEPAGIRAAGDSSAVESAVPNAATTLRSTLFRGADRLVARWR